MILGTFQVSVEDQRLILSNDAGSFSIPLAVWQRQGIEEIYEIAMEDARHKSRASDAEDAKWKSAGNAPTIPSVKSTEGGADPSQQRK